MAEVDLHLHSNCSDGSDDPAVVVARAQAMGLKGMALTDHDTVSGIAEARTAASARGIAFLAGTEISSFLENAEIHIVGLGVDEKHPTLIERLDVLRQARAVRVENMVAKLRGVGIDITLDEIVAEFGAGALGRMHVARTLRNKGVTRTTQEGFDRYLGAGRSAYVSKSKLHVEASIELIHEAGGVAFLAHPGLGNRLKTMLPHLLAFPFDGIEAYHISHSPAQTEKFLALAKERKLLVGGGSDCHGTIKKRPEMGKVRVPYPYFEAIQARLASR